MNSTIWLALALVLVLEGLGPLFYPRAWRKMVASLSQLPDNLLLYMNGAVCQIRIFGKGTSHITLCTFTCDGSAFLYSVHNICRDAYLFDNLAIIHDISPENILLVTI